MVCRKSGGRLTQGPCGLRTLPSLETATSTIDGSVITGGRPTLSLILPPLPSSGSTYGSGRVTILPGTVTLTVDVLRRPSAPLVHPLSLNLRT